MVYRQGTHFFQSLCRAIGRQREPYGLVSTLTVLHHLRNVRSNFGMSAQRQSTTSVPYLARVTLILEPADECPSIAVMLISLSCSPNIPIDGMHNSLPPEGLRER